MSRGRGRPRIQRNIKVTPIRRDEIDVRRLARALIALAQADERPREDDAEVEEHPDETA